MAREMKDSGIAWIGEIPESWDIAKLSLFYDIQLGKMLQPERRDETDTLENYLCAANLGGSQLKVTDLKKMWFSEDDKQKFAVQKGDLLVVEGGDVASCDVVRDDLGDIYIQNALHRVRSRMGFDVRFLRYYLMIAKATGHIDLICNKATIAHFTKEKFGAMPFLVASTIEQQRIATFLDAECSRIDAVIEKTRASIEEYKKLKQAVITQAVTKGIRPGRKMKDSGIESYGYIPENWDCCKLKYLIFSLNSGSAVTATDLIEDGYPLYGGGQQIGFYSEYNMEDTLVVGRVGARCGCVTKVEGKAWATDNALIVATDFPRDYLYYILVAAELNKLNTSNAQPLITSGKVLNFKVPVCWEREEQKEIAGYLNKRCAEIDELIAQKESLFTELETYKKSLIYEYVTGKKDVSFSK